VTDSISRLIVRATAALNEALDGGPEALYPTIARALALPCGPDARGAFFPILRDRFLPVGVDQDGIEIARSIPSALDIGPWATGGADGHAPFGYVRGPWITLAVGTETMRLGGAIVTDVTVPIDNSLRDSLQTIALHAAALGRYRAMLDAEKKMSMTDPLTGIPNRRRFTELLKRACEAREDYLLFFCDLDKFKEINDTKGHDAGDRALKDAANALSRAVRADETVGRIGGDEFVALVRAAEREAPAIKARLERAVSDAGLGCSVGWAIAIGDPTEVLRQSDLSMLSAKQGKSGARLTLVTSTTTSPA
jgi:diguanylate cyclase (GGDEF)-like protein